MKFPDSIITYMSNILDGFQDEKDQRTQKGPMPKMITFLYY